MQSSLGFLLNALVPLDQSQEMSIVSMTEHPYYFEILVKNAMSTPAGDLAISRYFGGLEVRTEMESELGNHCLKIQVSRLKIPREGFKGLDYLPYFKNTAKEGWFVGLSAFGPEHFKPKDLTHAILIGSTGYGKSVLFKSLLGQTLAYHPDIVSHIVDPKQVDFAPLARHPRVGVYARNRDDWSTLFTRIALEMLVREYYFKHSFADPPHHLEQWKEFRVKHNRADLPEFPRMVLWCDEAHQFFVDNYNDPIADLIRLIVRRGRAFGLHLFFGSQRLSDFPRDIWSQCNSIFNLYQSDGSLLSTHDVMAQLHQPTPVPGRLRFANPSRGRIVQAQSPYFDASESLILAWGEQLASKASVASIQNQGFLPLNIHRSALEHGKIVSLLLKGNSLESLAARNLTSLPEVNADARHAFRYQDLPPESSAAKSKPQQKIHTAEEADKIMREFNELVYKRVKPVDLAHARSTEEVAAQLRFQADKPDKLDESIIPPRATDPSLAISILTLPKTLSTDNAFTLEQLRDAYSALAGQGRADFTGYRRPTNRNQGLHSVKASLDGKNPNEAEWQQKVTDLKSLVLPATIKKRLAEFAKDMQSCASSGHRLPVLILTGNEGMGKVTVAKSVAHALRFTYEEAKSEQLLEWATQEQPAPDQKDAVRKALAFSKIDEALFFMRHCRSPHMPILILDSEKQPFGTNFDFRYLAEPHFHIHLETQTYQLPEMSKKLVESLFNKAGYLTEGEYPDPSKLARAQIRLTPKPLASFIERARQLALISGSPFNFKILEIAVGRFKAELVLRQPIVQIVQPQKTRGDFILSDALQKQMDELVFRARQMDAKRPEFVKKLRKDPRLTVLLSGPPGTGKTMTAEVLAQELKTELWICDFSKLIGSFVGDTEKALTELFETASRAGIVLLLDECDSLLRSRTLDGVSEHQGRWANHLLMLMESYGGTLVLTTNLADTIDKGFDRRIDQKIKLELPSIAEQIRILKSLLEPDAPCAKDLDLESVVQNAPLSGGLLRNVVERAVVRMGLQGESELTTALLREVCLEVFRESDGVGYSQKTVKSLAG